ncbi:hypothetical protein NPIL_203311 [Nephila pilipes]|uniref:Uncharacterized protein n=1 Tax=Nephila pilipes TaxID=299642 RepID=A0A8X6QDP4_NEPPI|nr:hypothetical protein NPIL_203311 [Nephila pilipes]
MELADENDSRPDTPITIDDSRENCEIRQNLENVIRLYSNLTRDFSTLIKNLETDPAFNPDDPVYLSSPELCERYSQYNNYRTEMEGKLKSLATYTKLSCLIHSPPN